MVNEEVLAKVFLWVFPLPVTITSMLRILLSGSGTVGPFEVCSTEGFIP
jgi:hypothetical protein